ncbi:MAG: hypothetical protein H8E14_11440 [Candidatus Marinimicrobia bacterium]|nr:hypothetical protein [Candidatus Neomarinimicrobiota bacterium]
MKKQQIKTGTRILVWLSTISLVVGYPVLHIKYDFLDNVLRALAQQ